jgi:hypothetical protein
MKDPQRWANKWLSQILHIVNSNAKGGLLAESTAFVDPIKAQEEWSSPDSITWMKEGALSGKKVQEKSMTNYPTGLDKLMQFALGSLPMVTGINLEALGLANREQAGVLESQRKQAAYGLLSPLFASLRLYRKAEGRVLGHMINDYIADGRLIRVGGPESQQFAPLLKAEGLMEYDVIVDQSPNAPDVKESTWEALIQLVPAMLKAGVPIPPDVLDYAPIPTALASKWKQFVEQQPRTVAPRPSKCSRCRSSCSNSLKNSSRRRPTTAPRWPRPRPKSRRCGRTRPQAAGTRRHPPIKQHGVRPKAAPPSPAGPAEDGAGRRTARPADGTRAPDGRATG